MKQTILCSILVLTLARVATAQLATYDAANDISNIIAAGQTVISLANQALELTGFDEIVLDGGDYGDDLEQLGLIIDEAKGLSFDLASLQRQVTVLFDLDTAPRSAGELEQRMREIRRIVWETRIYALRTQTLIRTVRSTVGHLTRLVSAIGGFLGNQQGNQTIAQLDGTLSKQLAVLQTQIAAHDRAETVERLTQPLVQESIDAINEEIFIDHPRPNR
jgi:conjugal transfer/entry exclusion protein